MGTCAGLSLQVLLHADDDRHVFPRLFEPDLDERRSSRSVPDLLL